MMKDNYELVYDNLLKGLQDIDLSLRVPSLGGTEKEGNLYLPFLGRPILISPQGMKDPNGGEPDVSTRIVLCHYLLRGGRGEIAGEWVSYRDFQDSGFFMANFQVNVEERVARHFAGKEGSLAEAARRLCGETRPGGKGDPASFVFRALPRIPLLLVFYDQDDDFPATAKLLFDRSASVWLDMECLAALGSILAGRLIHESSEGGGPAL